MGMGLREQRERSEMSPEEAGEWRSHTAGVRRGGIPGTGGQSMSDGGARSCWGLTQALALPFQGPGAVGTTQEM